MESEWHETTLGEFVRLQRGHDLTEADRRPGQVPIMGSAGHNGFHDTPKAAGPGVVIGRSGVGSMGVVTYCASDYWPHNTVLYVTDFLGNDERFTYYFLHHLNLRRFDSGSAQASLNRNYIYPICIRVPGPTEQRAIAHILGTLDDKIELNRRINETLEALARALFKSWFVDFDPVHAQAEGRDPDLPKSLANLFPDSFEDSELGEIPKGWRAAPFCETASLQRDTANPLDTPDADFFHFSIPAYDDGKTPIRELGASIKSLKFRVPEDSILFSKLNPAIERVWLVDCPAKAMAVCSTEFLVLRARRPFSRSFVYSLMCSTNFRRTIQSSVTGTSNSHQRTQPDSVLSILSPLPSRHIIDAFEKIVAPLLLDIQIKNRESRTLAALRDTLLSKLISGELRVKDAERIVEII